MSVHARKLPSDVTTTLDALVDPTARHERASPPEPSRPKHEREALAASDDAPRPRPVDATARVAVPDLPWYRRESWLAVQVSSFVPILGAVLLPEAYRLPLCVLGGSLVAIGTLMLLRRKPTPASPGSHSAGPI